MLRSVYIGSSLLVLLTAAASPALGQTVDEIVAKNLKAKGAEFTMELNEPRPGIRICFIRGPEGVSIEVLERSPN